MNDDSLYINNSPRKTGRKNRTPEQKRQIETRIEEARRLMILSFSDGDLKRMLAAKWGIRPRSVERYLARARERNRDILGRDEHDAKADSLGFWGRRLQEAEQSIHRSRAQMAKAAESIDKAEAVLDDPDALQEHKEIATARMVSASKVLDHARRTIYAASQESIGCQDRIDKLLGNYAPQKIARTNATGGDVPADIPEPTSAEDEAREIQSLWEQLQQRPGSVPGVN